MSFATFLSKVQHMFNLFEKEDEPLTESAKFRFLMEKVQNPQLEADISALKVKSGLGGTSVYDVVLMDMQMPVMGGIEACRIIRRRDGGHAKATVIFVTAHAAEEFETKCLGAGASGFLPKPFNIGDIEKCFQRLQGTLGASVDRDMAISQGLHPLAAQSNEKMP